jgi:sarcosine oxidase subunit beta
MGKLKNSSEVVIVGGGIMGTSTAYYLAKRGASDVILLERDLLAQATTGLSVGGIRQQFSHPANIRLSQHSVRVFENFKEEFGVDIYFRKAGYLFLAQKEKTWIEFLSSVETQREMDVPVEVLTPEEIKRRWPYLRVDDLVGGTFGPEDGYADPYLVAMGFADQARKLGVRIEEKTEVTGIRIKNGKVEGVETTRGPIAVPVVVNVAGPWAGEVARMAGLEFPAKPYRRQVFATSPFDAIPKPVPMVIDQDLTFYFRGEEPNIIMGMSDAEEPSSFNTHVDRDFMEKVSEAAVHRAPILEKAEIIRGWGGLYTITPDDNPIIGADPGVEGFFYAIGFSGHGFQHAPAVGLIMSDLILCGRSSFDLKPFAYDRFDGIKKGGERRVV